MSAHPPVEASLFAGSSRPLKSPRNTGRRCEGNPRGLDHEVSETEAAMADCDAEVVDLRPGPNQGHTTRTIPPSTRKAVLLADGRRCVVPDCRCTVWLDIHHGTPRSEGGRSDPWNLFTLCGAHHRLLHDGLLAVERRSDGGVNAIGPDQVPRSGPARLLWTHIPRPAASMRGWET